MHSAKKPSFPALHAVLFDLGNTLVFPDRNATLLPLHERGVFPTSSQIQVSEKAARKLIDQQLLGNQTAAVDRGYWYSYYEALLGELSLHDEALNSELVSRAGQSENWSVLADDAIDVLSSLHRNYALCIVSNSDERVKVLISRLGIDKYFNCVIASSVIGFEKPHRRIFEQALQSLAVDADNALYVGDIYSVDYLGATKVGMRAVLMDVYDVYPDRGVPRVRSLRELQAIIEDRL